MTLVNFEQHLKKYARLIAEIGVGVKPGHTVSLNISVDQAKLARLITKEAYTLGAKEVIVLWNDEEITKETLLHASAEVLETPSTTVLARQEELLGKNAARISVVSSNPEAFAAVEKKRLATFQATNSKLSKPTSEAVQANKISWTVVAAASVGWAKVVFPDLSEEAAVDKLWDEIFKTTRIYEENPVVAWQEHDKKLNEKAIALNEEQFDALHYTAPEVDIVFGLPENYHFEGASSKNIRGDFFMANMPTEEVFAAPDRNRVDGTIVSTRPLSYAGTIIDGMRFTFKHGKVIEFSAEKGEEVLRDLLDTDEGARYLGEIALVPDPSPISQSKITFFNTLFDENASNHLALGSAYAFSVQGGEKMTKEELQQAGLNRSNIHVDFMVGSDKMDIDGIKKDGTRLPIFRNGDWV